MNLNGHESSLQFSEKKNDNIIFNFSYKGNNVSLYIYDEAQFKYKKHMPEPKVIDHAKNILSPMPGAIVSVSVKAGDWVVEGQELLVMEAMKMQNIIKSEVKGEVEAVFIKSGDSVAVDEILIKFK
jgi:propionyl-CoA carboxylase alpha chain